MKEAKTKKMKSIASILSVTIAFLAAFGIIPSKMQNLTNTITLTASAADPYAVTTTAGLIIRTGPSTSYPKLTVIPYNTQINIEYISNGWAKIVNFKGYSGYVSANYITRISGVTYYVITQAGLRLRSQPNTSSSTLKTMPYRSAVTVYSQSSNWYYCSYNGTYGYASKDYLKPDQPSANTNLSYAVYKNSSARITCGYDGYTTTKGRHEGIDVKLWNGASIYAIADGVVTRVAKGYSGTNGLSTIAIYNESSNKTVVYLHSNPDSGLYAGKRISKGQYLGTEGWRGCSSSSGSHTHVEIRNGRHTHAAKSLNDYTLENPNPATQLKNWGYNVK